MLEEDALASDVGPHFGNVPVGLGKMAANHRSKDTGIPDCEKSKPPPWKVYLGEAQLWRRQAHMLSWRWRLGPARFGSYKTPGGGCFRIYRPSSVRRLQLGSCDCCHRLLFEYPSFFGRPICASRSRLGSSWSCRFTPV